MNITLYQDETVFSDVKWENLLANSAADTIFLTHTWMSSWWEAYHPGEIWALAVHEGEQLVGFAPWFRLTRADGKRVIYAIGSVDVTDYIDVVICRGYEDTVLSVLADYLAANSDQFDELCLCNFPEDSPTLVHMPRLLKDRGFSVSIDVEDVCPVVVLPEDWKTYVTSLDSKERHELRRKLRRAGGGTEKVDWYIVGPEHDLDAELAQFMRLMAASGDEKQEFLEDSANAKFFRYVIPRIAERGWLQLAFLTVNGDAAATYLNFVYGDRVLVYNSGLEPQAYGHLSPGIVLLARLIEYAIKQQYTVVDFLRGNESYKYKLGGKDTEIFTITASRAN